MHFSFADAALVPISCMFFFLLAHTVIGSVVFRGFAIYKTFYFQKNFRPSGGKKTSKKFAASRRFKQEDN